jgi:hypothetical protein
MIVERLAIDNTGTCPTRICMHTKKIASSFHIEIISRRSWRSMT